MTKKFISLTVLLAIAGFTLLGCSNVTPESNSTTDVGGDETEKIEITYANWNLGTEEENNLERQMIAAYMEQNPHVQIRIADNVAGTDYGEMLTTAAAGGILPDVFMLQNIPTPLSNEWLLDLSAFIENDDEWKMISLPVVESTKYNGTTYAIPAGQFLAGYFINTDLFKQENLPVLEFGYTLNQFESAVKSLTSLNKGIIGFEDVSTFVDWYPSIKNNNLGWFTWDGDRYNLDTPEFKEGINKTKEFNSNGYVFNNLSEEEKQNFKGTSGWETWIEGEVAFKYDGSWGTGGFKELGFETKFIGLPNSKVGIINDYIGISNSAKNQKEAYDFAKWMTFSKEGTLKRIELAEAAGTVYGSLPLINDEEVLERYLDHNPFDGIKEAYDEIDNGIVEPFKYLPGYTDSRWGATTGLTVGDKENASIGDIVNDCQSGTSKIEDYATRINELANKKYQEAQISIKALQ